MGKFMNPIIFGKADTKFPGLPDFDFFFKALVYLNANVAGPKSMEVYKAMMGKSWGSQITAKAKTKAKTKAKLKINVKSAGDAIKKGANAVGDWFNKAGKSVADGVKSAAKGVADSVTKAAAGLKKGVKLNVKAAPKAKVSLKAGAKAAPKAKVSLKAGASAKPKAKVTVKAGAKKSRRLQAADKPDEKKDEKKDTTPVETNMELSKDGLPVSEYAGDVDMPSGKPPYELKGAKDQEAPRSANLVKLCFMLFAALLTMY